MRSWTLREPRNWEWDMNINPAAIGIGAGVAGGLAFGIGATKYLDGVSEKHPTGSRSDTIAGWTTGAGIGAGVLTAGGGVLTLSKNVHLGAALLGTGFGLMAGAIGSSIAFNARHGVGVDSITNSTMSAYDRNWSGKLELNTTWRTPESIRRVEHRHEDSEGRVRYDYDFYSIDALTAKADAAPRDGVVNRSELHDVYADYDKDGNGRLQGEEYKRADREVGERWIGSSYWGWY